MIQILFLLSVYRANIRVKGPYGVHSSLEFGFSKDGEYIMTLSNPSAPMVFGLATNYELDENSILYYEMGSRPNVCHGNMPLSAVQRFVDFNETVTLRGATERKTVLTPFYYGCEEEYTFSVEIDFINGKSHLDYRMYPSSICTPIFIGLFGLLFVLWLVNWFTHFTLDIKIHYFLTTCFGLAVILRGLYYGYLLDLKKVGFLSDSINYSYGVFDSINTLFLLITLILAARGWYIISKKIEGKPLIAPIIFSAAYVILSALLNFLSLGFYDFLIAIGALVCLGFYIFYLTRYVNESLFKITAHIVVIKNQGIDPKTTPVYQKYKMFKLYFRALIVYCICIMVQLFTEVFSGNLLWLPRLLSDLSSLILLCFLFYIFMIRQKRNNGYLIFEEDGDPEEFSQNDIQSFQVDGVEQAAGNEWDENTPLPPVPIIVKNPNEQQPSQTNERGTAPEGANEYSLENIDTNPTLPDGTKNPYKNPIVAPQA